MATHLNLNITPVFNSALRALLQQRQANPQTLIPFIRLPFDTIMPKALLYSHKKITANW